MVNSFDIVEVFESQLAQYTGSKFAVATDSCTNAIFLCCKLLNVQEVTIPCKTYVSVPCSILNAGGKVRFSPKEWSGEYALEPYPIIDSALRFKRNMYRGGYRCVSFSVNKFLPIGKGGAILTDDATAVHWFKKARYCGRNNVPHQVDHFDMIGWNMYMTPEQAARGLQFLDHAQDQYDDLHQVYQDLSVYEVFQCPI